MQPANRRFAGCLLFNFLAKKYDNNVCSCYKIVIFVTISKIAPKAQYLIDINGASVVKTCQLT